MKNIKLYELWGDEDSEKEEGVEILSKMLDASKKDISHISIQD
jgi:hypothetical protein